MPEKKIKKIKNKQTKEHEKTSPGIIACICCNKYQSARP